MKIKDVKKMKQPWDRFLYWISERESIRKKREKNLPAPWTDDEILQRYRFCNVRRMDDKVSRWLLTNWYEPYFNHPNILAAVALARFFNKPESLGLIAPFLFDDEIGWGIIETTLRASKKNGPVFNGAYMVRGNSTKSPDKIGTVVDEYVRPLVESSKEGRIVYPESMEKTHSTISCFYGFGSFMAGQVVADLRWAVSGTWLDRKKWAPIGPGSARGLNRLYGFSPKSSQSKQEFEGMLEDTISLCYKRVPKSISSRCEAIDFQNCLCEFDKYERALGGEGKPKQLYRGAL